MGRAKALQEMRGKEGAGSVSARTVGGPAEGHVGGGREWWGEVVLQKPGDERRVRMARGHLETRK